MLEHLRKGGEVVEWTDHVNVMANPTLASDCADAMMAMYLSKQHGVFHCAGREYVDRVELGRQVAQAFGLNASKVRAATQAEMEHGMKVHAPGPLPRRTCLDVADTERLLGRVNVGLAEGLQEWKRQMVEPVA